MKKVLVVSLVTLLVGFIGFYIYCRNFAYNENYLQLAKDATAPNMNFLFARNASLVGRVYMTFSGKEFKPCINTATAFFNNFDTCSNCEDFVKNPQRWGFEQIASPKIGDIVIQHNPKTDRAFHAAIIVNMENDRYYVSHAIKTKYYKNVELNNKSRLTFYRFKS